MLLPSWVVSGKFLNLPWPQFPLLPVPHGTLEWIKRDHAFMSACCVLGTFLDAGDAAVNETDYITSVLVIEVRT